MISILKNRLFFIEKITIKKLFPAWVFVQIIENDLKSPVLYSGMHIVDKFPSHIVFEVGIRVNMQPFAFVAVFPRFICVVVS